MLEAVRQKSIDPSISKRLAAAIIRILYSPVSKVADWRPTTEPARGSNPWGPTERRSGPVRNGRWIRAGNGERVRKKRRSPIVVRHSRRPFSVHCLAFIPCAYTPRLRSPTFHETMMQQLHLARGNYFYGVSPSVSALPSISLSLSS